MLVEYIIWHDGQHDYCLSLTEPSYAHIHTNAWSVWLVPNTIDDEGNPLPFVVDAWNNPFAGEF